VRSDAGGRRGRRGPSWPPGSGKDPVEQRAVRKAAQEQDCKLLPKIAREVIEEGRGGRLAVRRFQLGSATRDGELRRSAHRFRTWCILDPATQHDPRDVPPAVDAFGSYGTTGGLRLSADPGSTIESVPAFVGLTSLKFKSYGRCDPGQLKPR
jgi:hypothetical protein